MLIYDSFRAVFDCFSTNNDRRVAKISTPTITLTLWFWFSWFQIDIVTQCTFSPLYDELMRRCQINCGLARGAKAQNILHYPHKQLWVKKTWFHTTAIQSHFFGPQLLDYITLLMNNEINECNSIHFINPLFISLTWCSVSFELSHFTKWYCNSDRRINDLYGMPGKISYIYKLYLSNLTHICKDGSGFTTLYVETVDLCT